MLNLNDAMQKAHVGQLKNGKWVVCNLRNTALYFKTFKTEQAARDALAEYRNKVANQEFNE